MPLAGGWGIQSATTCLHLPALDLDHVGQHCRSWAPRVPACRHLPLDRFRPGQKGACDAGHTKATRAQPGRRVGVSGDRSVPLHRRQLHVSHPRPKVTDPPPPDSRRTPAVSLSSAQPISAGLRELIYAGMPLCVSRVSGCFRLWRARWPHSQKGRADGGRYADVRLAQSAGHDVDGGQTRGTAVDEPSCPSAGSLGACAAIARVRRWYGELRTRTDTPTDSLPACFNCASKRRQASGRRSLKLPMAGIDHDSGALSCAAVMISMYGQDRYPAAN